MELVRREQAWPPTLGGGDGHLWLSLERALVRMCRGNADDS